MNSTQLDLFEARHTVNAGELVEFLNEGARTPVHVALTRNRVSMVSVQFPVGRPVKLRLHEAFLSAPPEIRVALRRYLRTRRKDAWQPVADFAGTIESPDRKVAPRLRKRGRVYDLGLLFESVNLEYFSNQLTCQIGWGRDRPRARRSRRSKSIRYGSWSPSANQIRIHPRLDDERVPAEFVRYIVFHEMLHAVVPAETRNGRRLDHSPAFRKLESQYPDFQRMKALSKALLDELID